MKHLLKHFTELSLHPKNAEELKGLILQLAVEGKLTAKWREENPNVESASALLDRIEEERIQLIATKKIKKGKTLPNISEEEISFDLPNFWAWSRLGEIIKISSGKGLTSANMDKSGKIPVYGGNGITGYHSIGNVDQQTIVIGRVGYYCGSIHLTEEEAWVTDNAFITQYSEENIFRDYLLLLLRGTNLKEDENATAQPVISGRKVYPIVIALPPLQEQKAIVKTVNQLFKEVEQLETLTKERIQLKEDFATSALQELTTSKNTKKEWAFLQKHFSSFFTEKSSVKKLRESILQLAMQGKLTRQWREENSDVEDASILLERIREEKRQWVMEKKIKKEMVLPDITAKEIPYKLPKGWVWCRMGNVSNIQRGSSPRPKGDPRYFSNSKTKNHWISIKDISRFAKNHFLLDTEEYLTDLGTQHSRYVYPNELIVAVSGSTTGKCCLTAIDGYIYDGLALIRLINKSIDIQYQLMYMLQLYNHMNNSKFGAAFPNINTKFLNEMLFPFPPIEEQKVIVKKVNALMHLCDQLEQEIQTSKSLQEDWMKSSLREVFEVEAVSV